VSPEITDDVTKVPEMSAMCHRQMNSTRHRQMNATCLRLFGVWEILNAEYEYLPKDDLPE
jgi:hypothetical protein